MRSFRPVVVGIILLMLMGCKERAMPPTPALPTATLQATLTPLASATPLPTATSRPGATAVQTGQHEYSVDLPDGGGEASQDAEVRFLLYLPRDYGADLAQRWPLILYLHGSGEAGTDLKLLLSQPLPKMLETTPDFPFVVISPQIPAATGNYYEQPGDMQVYLAVRGWNSWFPRLNRLLDYLQANYALDEDRVYLTGISLGGFGAWNYALKYPERFAAVVPIAGGYQYGSQAVPANICDLARLGVWAFHGAEDTTVYPIQTEGLIEALTPCGGDVRMTIYPGVGHNAWDAAYRDEEMWDWLLGHTSRR